MIKMGKAITASRHEWIQKVAEAEGGLRWIITVATFAERISFT
jgi:hypothetical protein